ncbi:MAG: hypothetical protein AAGF75_07155, partial [Cyanobacteria bacterium P01_H01_bin.130]
LISDKNRIEIGNWSKKKQKIVLFDLVHVNQALTSHNTLPVDGIIGADVLKKGKAVIDYDKKCLYLKKHNHHRLQITRRGGLLLGLIQK